MTEPDVPVLDTLALRRRVLLTGIVTMVLFLAVALAITSTGLPDAMVLPAMVVLYAAVVRPLMQPVRDAVRLRRHLAYQAFLEQRENGRG